MGLQVRSPHQMVASAKILQRVDGGIRGSTSHRRGFRQLVCVLANLRAGSIIASQLLVDWYPEALGSLNAVSRAYRCLHWPIRSTSL